MLSLVSPQFPQILAHLVSLHIEYKSARQLELLQRCEAFVCDVNTTYFIYRTVGTFLNIPVS